MTVVAAYVGFGSNLGDRLQNYREALEHLDRRQWRVMRESRLYESQPWGGAQGGEFLNAVLEIEPQRTPQDLLRDLQEIEQAMGRPANHERFGPRSCDLDILLWRTERVHECSLTVPHPRLFVRRFVLAPLCDLIADCVYPGTHLTFRQLLTACADPCEVRQLTV